MLGRSELVFGHDGWGGVTMCLGTMCGVLHQKVVYREQVCELPMQLCSTGNAVACSLFGQNVCRWGVRSKVS